MSLIKNKNLSLGVFKNKFFFILIFIFIIFYFFQDQYLFAKDLENFNSNSFSNQVDLEDIIKCLEKNSYTIQVYSDLSPENISRSKILNTQEVNPSESKFLLLDLVPKAKRKWYSGYLGLFPSKPLAEKQLEIWLDQDVVPYDSFVYRLSPTQLQRIKIELYKGNQKTYLFAKQVLCPKVSVAKTKKISRNDVKKVSVKQHPAKKLKNKIIVKDTPKDTQPEKKITSSSTKTRKVFSNIDPYFQMGVGTHFYQFRQDFRNIGKVDQTEIIPSLNYFVDLGAVVNDLWTLGVQYRAVQTKTPKIVGVPVEDKNLQTTHLNLLMKYSIFESYKKASHYLGLKYGEHKITYLAFEVNDSGVKLSQNSVQSIGIGYTYKLRHTDDSEFFEASVFYDHILKSKNYKPKSQQLFEIDYGFWLFQNQSLSLGFFMNHSIYSAQNYPISDATTDDYKQIQQINNVLEFRGKFD